MARKKELREIIYVTVVLTCIDYLTRSSLREDTFILVYDINAGSREGRLAHVR